MPIVVWLDSNSDNINNTFLKKVRDFEHVETFTEIDSCVHYMKSNVEQPIFLITSGTFALQIVSQIYDLSNILMIFVFCASMKTYTNWALDFVDKLLMFDQEDDLLPRLWYHFEEYSREQAKIYNKKADECKERAKKLNQPCG